MQQKIFLCNFKQFEAQTFVKTICFCFSNFTLFYFPDSNRNFAKKKAAIPDRITADIRFTYDEYYRFLFSVENLVFQKHCSGIKGFYT